MPTPTWVALANTTLTSTATSVVFGSIPNTYRDLVLVWSGDSGSVGMRINGDTGTNYTQVFTQNATAYSGAADSAIALSNFGWSGNPHMFICNIMDYSATNRNKMIISRGNIEVASGRTVIMHAARWANTNAVTSVTVYNFSGNMSIGTQIALYGIVS